MVWRNYILGHIFCVFGDISNSRIGFITANLKKNVFQDVLRVYAILDSYSFNSLYNSQALSIIAFALLLMNLKL